MPRGRSPERDEARKLWLESEGTLLLKEIAAKLGVPEGRVRKWKSEDKWAAEKEQSEKERTKKTKRNVPKQRTSKEAPTPRKKGAPIGNTNAAGNPGGVGAPEGNQRGLKHGAYRKVLESTLTEDEREIYNDVGISRDADELDALYRTLCIKEVRLMQRIKELREKSKKSDGFLVSSISRTDSEAYYGLFADRADNLVSHGIDPDGLTKEQKAVAHRIGGIGRYADDYMSKSVKTDTQLVDNYLLKLEAELDKVLKRKAEVLRMIAAMKHTDFKDNLDSQKFAYERDRNVETDRLARDKYELEKMKFDGGGKTEIVDDWVSAVIGEPVENAQEGESTDDQT